MYITVGNVLSYFCTQKLRYCNNNTNKKSTKANLTKYIYIYIKLPGTHLQSFEVTMYTNTQKSLFPQKIEHIETFYMNSANNMFSF